MIIVYMLAHIGCIDLLEGCLPGASLRREDDIEEACRAPCIDAAWKAYFAARASAGFNTEAKSNYQEMLVNSLSLIQKEFLKERLDYRYHGDVNRLLESALGYVSNILSFSAMLLGNHDGESNEPFEADDNLDLALQDNGLKSWLTMYNSDLQELWVNRGYWESDDDFLSLNIHVNRVLWQLGLFPWKTPDGQYRVEVPIASDVKELMIRLFLKQVQHHTGFQ